MKGNSCFFCFWGLEFCEFQASHFASQIVCLFVCLFFFPAFLDLVVAPNLITHGKVLKKNSEFFLCDFFLFASLKPIIFMLF